MVRTKGIFLRRNRRYGTRKVTRKTTSTVVRRAVRVGYRRLTKANRVLAKLYNAPSPFPRTRLVRHRYVENVSFPGGAAGAARQYVFVANDMFDPNFTGVGHQPMYRDEMQAKYDFYTVLRAYIKVTFDQSDANMQNYGLVLGQDTTVVTTPSTMKEQYSATKPIVASRRNGPLTLTKVYDAMKVNKTTMSGILSDDTQKVASGGSPSSKITYYFIPWAAPVDAALVTTASLMQVEIVYTVMWREPHDAVAS